MTRAHRRARLGGARRRVGAVSQRVICAWRRAVFLCYTSVRAAAAVAWPWPDYRRTRHLIRVAPMTLSTARRSTTWRFPSMASRMTLRRQRLAAPAWPGARRHPHSRAGLRRHCGDRRRLAGGRMAALEQRAAGTVCAARPGTPGERGCARPRLTRRRASACWQSPAAVVLIT